MRDRQQGDDNQAARPPSSYDRSQSPERGIINTSRIGSRRAPSSYHHQVRGSRNPQENTGARVSYSDEDPPTSRTRRLSYSQDSEYTYTPNAPRSHYIERIVHHDDISTQEGLAIRPRAREADSAHENIIASDVHGIRRNLPEPAIISSAGGTAHGTSVQTPISTQTTTHSTSARPSESSFRSSLSPTLQQFASIPRNDWKAIEVYVTKDDSILDAQQLLFLKEAIQAFSSIGKDEYAKQCVHRVALLQQVEGCSIKSALKKIKNIGERKSEAKDFLETYDRIQKAAKERAKAMPASAGTGVVQPSSLGPTPAFPVNQISSVRRGDISSHQENTVVTGPDVRAQTANISASYHRASQPSNTDLQDDLRHRDPRNYQYQVPTQDSLFTAGSSPATRTLNQPSPRPNDVNPYNYTGTRPPVNLPSTKSDASDDESASTPKQTNRQSGSVASITTSEISVTGENTFPLPAGQHGQLDPRFQPRHHSFYKVGTVFSVLWHVPGSTEPPKGYTSEKRVLTAGKYGEPIYSTIRRMVVVREGHGYCVCIQINTYGGRGLKKFSRTPGEIENHSIIHMTNAQACYIKDEPRSSKKPIAVTRANQYQKLEPESRICYSQPSTVQHNVKAMPVGQVTPESLPWLVYYYRQANN